jgi:hypothetical protein
LVVGAAGAGTAAGAAIGAAAGACAFCAQALVAADTEIARAIAKALRITFSILKNAHLVIFIAALNYQVNVMLGYHRNANIYWPGDGKCLGRFEKYHVASAELRAYLT